MGQPGRGEEAVLLRSLILEALGADSVQQQPAPLEPGRLWPCGHRLRCLSSTINIVHAVVGRSEHVHGSSTFG